jgi:ADP-ribose pyrophosphatase YjhB (NUDIX family)
MIQENLAEGKIEQAGCGIIVNYNNSILLLKQIKTDYNDDSWTIPWGGISNDESFEEGFKRWGIKDLGLNIEVDELVGTLDLYDYFNIDILQYNIVSNFKEKPKITIDQSRYSEYEFVKLDQIKELYLQKLISEATFQSLLPLIVL